MTVGGHRTAQRVSHLCGPDLQQNYTQSPYPPQGATSQLVNVFLRGMPSTGIPYLSKKSLSETVKGPRVHGRLARQTRRLCLQSDLKSEVKIQSCPRI